MIYEGLKKNDAEKLRKSALSEEEYENKYSGLNHLFYDKNFFIDIAKQLDCTIEVFPQNCNHFPLPVWAFFWLNLRPNFICK